MPADPAMHVPADPLLSPLVAPPRVLPLVLPLASLLAAVRRHLWLQAGAQGVRVTAWCAAAACASMALVHGLLLLAGLALPAAALAGLLVVLGLGAAVWVLRRRPTDTDCARWADRHLGGASAYSTWLDGDGGGDRDGVGRERLARWMQARVAHSLRALGERSIAWGCARPVLAFALALGVALLALQRQPEATVVGTPTLTLADTAWPRGGDMTPDAPQARLLDDALNEARRPARAREQGLAGDRSSAQALTASDAADAEDPGKNSPGMTTPAPTPARTATPAPAQDPAGTGNDTRLHTGAPTRGDGTTGGMGDGRGDAAGVGRRAATQAPVAGVGMRTRPALGRGGEQASDRAAAAYDRSRSGAPLGDPAGGHQAAVPAARRPVAQDGPRFSPTELDYLQAWHQARPR